MFGSLTNSGTMPVSGGDATSGNGDQAQENKNSFGGINYKNGVPTWAIVAGIAVFLGAAAYKLRS